MGGVGSACVIFIRVYIAGTCCSLFIFIFLRYIYSPFMCIQDSNEIIENAEQRAVPTIHYPCAYTSPGLLQVPGGFGLGHFGIFLGWVVSDLVSGSFQPCVISAQFQYGREELRTTRPKEKSAQDNSAHKKSAQDNSAQVVPISEDNSVQIASTLEDLSAHENQTRHLLMY